MCENVNYAWCINISMYACVLFMQLNFTKIFHHETRVKKKDEKPTLKWRQITRNTGKVGQPTHVMSFRNYFENNKTITLYLQLYSVHPIVWFSRSYKTSLFESTKSASKRDINEGLEDR